MGIPIVISSPDSAVSEAYADVGLKSSEQTQRIGSTAEVPRRIPSLISLQIFAEVPYPVFFFNSFLGAQTG